MRRVILVATLAALLGLAAAACSGETEFVDVVVTVEVERVVEKEVVREVEVEKVVTVEVVKVVEVEKEVVVEVEKVVEVDRVLVATPTPLPAGTPRFGGTLRIVSQGSISALDPGFSIFYVVEAVSTHMFEALFGWDENLETAPRLVRRWELSDDNLTYTFDLRDDVKFHNGDDLTAQDVVVSLERWRTKPGAAVELFRQFTQTGEISAIDDGTLIVTLSEPMGALIDVLGFACCNHVVMPEEWAVTPTTEPVGELVGTGAFKFAEWDLGNRVVLERFDDYTPRRGRASGYTGETIAYLDKLIWLEIPDEETKAAGLQTGEWDVVDGMSFDFFKRLTDDPNIFVPQYKPGNYSWIALNPQTTPMNELKVRQALQAATDEEQFMSALGPNTLWQLCPATYYCGSPLEVRDGEELYNLNDMNLARQLLSESDYDGSTVVILNPTDYGTITPLGFVLKPLLEDIGFDVEMPAYDWATVTSMIGSTDQYSIFTAWSSHYDSGNPVTDFQIAGSFDWIIRDEELIELRLSYILEADAARRFEIVREINLQKHTKVPVLYLGQFFPIDPMSVDVKNYRRKAYPWYGNVWLER